MTDNSITDSYNASIPTDRFHQLFNLDKSTLAAIIDHLPFSARIFDSTGNLIAVNGKWEKLWGIDSRDMIGRFNWLKDKETINSVPVEVFRQTLSGQTIHLPPIQCHIQRPNSSPSLRQLKRTCYPIGSGVDRVRYIVLLEEDLTDYIQPTDNSIPDELQSEREKYKAGISPTPASEIIQQEHEQLLSIFDSIDEAIYVCDPGNHNLLFINKKIKEHCGDILGRKCYEALQHNDSPCPFCTNKYIFGENLGETYYWIFSNPVNNRTYRCMDKAIHWPDGRLVRYEMAIDITERIEIEKELKRAQKMEALGTFAAGITHDFNNILNTILGYAYQAKKLATPDSVLSSKIEGISNSARRAAELVRELLQFSRQNDQKRTPTALQPIIEEIIRHKKNTLPANIVFRTNISKDCEKISCNPIQIHQVVTNVLTNAHHAIKQHGGIITVNLTKVSTPTDLPPSLSQHNNVVKLSISDTGEGISPDTIEKIFQPYFTTRTFEKGMGLGLAIVHSIVSNHGGAVTVKSEPRQGTTFNLFFPVSTDGAHPKRWTTKDNRLPTTRTDSTKNFRILLIDDEQFNVQNTEAFLSDAHFSVSPYTNALKALEDFSQHPEKFDLIITDHRMPELTGLELAEKISAIRDDIPIILITGWAEMMNGDTIGKYNLKKIVPKPYDSKFLISTINSLVTKQHC
ncbi:MAG: ATP-binding protein [Desulfobulbaceae bacterium]|nr:ATP-binding protein [Desulfobulbaceae bacterium]